MRTSSLLLFATSFFSFFIFLNIFSKSPRSLIRARNHRFRDEWIKLEKKRSLESNLKTSAAIEQSQQAFQLPTEKAEDDQRIEVLDSIMNKTSMETKEYMSERYGDYCVFPHVFTAKGRKKRISMMLHTSADYMGNNLLTTASSWDGKISLAIAAAPVLTSNNETYPSVANTIIKLHKMILCHKSLSDSLDAHVFMQWNGVCPKVSLELPTGVDCGEILPDFTPFAHNNPTGMYPVNTARNIARLYHKANLILFADMEQEYSIGAEKLLREQANALDITKSNLVLVVRRFEYRTGTTSPRTMEQLQSVFEKTTFQFHKFFYPIAHHINNVKSWLKGKNETYIVDVKARNTTTWEPMFLSSSSIPLHDESLTYGVADNLAIAMHLCCLNYRFAIANGVFNVHEGIRQAKATVKMSYNNRNRGVMTMKQFYISLATRYPETARQCLKNGFPKNLRSTTAAP